MGRLLIIDDDPRFLQVMVSLLSAQSHEVVTLTVPDSLIQALEGEPFDLAIFDLHMGQTNGLDLLQYTRDKKPELPVIMLTAYGTVDTALQALKLGAFDYVTKPFKVAEFIAVIDRALKQSGETVEELNLSIPYGLGEIVAASDVMVQVCKLVEQIAPSDVPVLMQGESGVGKKFAATALHRASRRREKPVTIVSCANPTEAQLEADLFGYVRDAFEGAAEDKDGVFMQANGGTVILEEVAALPSGLQGPLLKLLKDKTIRPLGVDTDIPVDVRLLATTSTDIAERVTQGQFDSNLYTRLTAISLEIPPLRDRREDVIPLARHFVKHLASTPNGARTFSADARGLMLHYDWPGNVLDLHDTVRYVVEATEDALLTSKHFPEAIIEIMAGKQISPLNVDSSPGRGVAAANFIRSKSATLSTQISQTRSS
jgi:DNA-binding NtrC family response regulator